MAAAALRTLPLLENRFHPDEALYAYFGRLIASGHDPLLAGVLVDKPPLSFYLTALSLWLVGPHELAARLPEFWASLVSVALIYSLGRRLYGPRLGVLAAWLLALSPFAILFAITVFVDPLLTAAILWALWAAAAGRWRTLAAALSVAFAIKQTALVFVPLALALAVWAPPSPAHWRALGARQARVLRPLLAALAITLVLILGWDQLRHPPIGFWAQGYSDNLPGRLVRATEVLPRALAWINLQRYFTSSNLVNGLFLIGLPLLLIFGGRAASRMALADYLIAVYLLVYLAAYWLLAFNVWDRYLLPVLPLWL
ncbi:MAG: glycosyltransferase family 39 protein, partial [Anaerolineales bacterium]